MIKFVLFAIISGLYLNPATVTSTGYVTVLQDNAGNVWELEEVDLEAGQEVTCLMFNNMTDDITDDVILNWKEAAK